MSGASAAAYVVVYPNFYNRHVTIRVYKKSAKQVWYCGSVIHRVHGPAIVHANGATEWYIDGKLHRTDGPAIERATKKWYIEGKLHRLDGPAIE